MRKICCAFASLPAGTIISVAAYVICLVLPVAKFRHLPVPSLSGAYCRMIEAKWVAGGRGRRLAGYSPHDNEGGRPEQRPW